MKEGRLEAVVFQALPGTVAWAEVCAALHNLRNLRRRHVPRAVRAVVSYGAGYRHVPAWLHLPLTAFRHARARA